MIEIQCTPEEFRAKAARLQSEHGIALNGDAGRVTAQGVTAAYAYQDGLLTVNILEKPFFVSTEYCESKMREFFAG